jgi:hypothetical protein
VGRELSANWLRLGEQQATLLHVAEQFVFGKDAVEAFLGEPAFATLVRIGQTHTDISGTIIGHTHFDILGAMIVQTQGNLAKAHLCESSGTGAEQGVSKHRTGRAEYD